MRPRASDRFWDIVPASATGTLKQRSRSTKSVEPFPRSAASKEKQGECGKLRFIRLQRGPNKFLLGLSRCLVCLEGKGNKRRKGALVVAHLDPFEVVRIKFDLELVPVWKHVRTHVSARSQGKLVLPSKRRVVCIRRSADSAEAVNVRRIRGAGVHDVSASVIFAYHPDDRGVPAGPAKIWIAQRCLSASWSTVRV